MILLCQPCSPSVSNEALQAIFRGLLPGEKLFAPQTTSSLLLPQNVWPFTGWRRRPCGTTHRSESTKGRRKSGTVQVCSPLVANTLSRQGGEPAHQWWSGGATSPCRRVIKASASWALHLDILEWVLEVLVAFAVCLLMTPKLPGHRERRLHPPIRMGLTTTLPQSLKRVHAPPSTVSAKFRDLLDLATATASETSRLADIKAIQRPWANCANLSRSLLSGIKLTNNIRSHSRTSSIANRTADTCSHVTIQKHCRSRASPKRFEMGFRPNGGGLTDPSPPPPPPRRQTPLETKKKTRKQKIPGVLLCCVFSKPSAGPPSADRPKFRSFFLSRHIFETCTFGLSGCRVNPRRPPALQTPPKFHEKTPRERQKRAKWRRERKKKARNFGSFTLRGSTFFF